MTASNEAHTSLQDPFQNLLPDGIELDLVVDNAKSHNSFSMEFTRRSRRTLLSKETEGDRYLRFRFDSICENFERPTTSTTATRRLHANASFPPPNEPRRRPPIETNSFDRWASSSDSEISYNHDESALLMQDGPQQPASSNAQRPARKRSADADALSALIATMQATGEFDFDS